MPFVYNRNPREMTYAQAHDKLLAQLEQMGWTLSPRHLKVRHATDPTGTFRLWFKAQAIYFTNTITQARHSMKFARTLTYDTQAVKRWAKDLGLFVKAIRIRMRPEQLVALDAALERVQNPVRLSPDIPPRKRARNPGEPSPSAVSRYTTFHGVEPAEFQAGELWVPGNLTLIGEAVEVNYQIIDPDSDKDLNQVYFHDHGPRVKVYKRCERGEPVDLSYATFPKDLVVLGSFPGLTLHTDDGRTEEIPGSKKKLVAAPDKRRLVIVDARGVLYLIKGGKLKVEDWIYN